MPLVITLDDLEEMIIANENGYRFETSPEGALTALPLPDSGHAVLVTRLMHYLLTADWPAEQVIHAAALRIPGPEQDGGRMPDVTLWRRPLDPSAKWNDPADLHLVVEIISRGSASNDQFAKVAEYASAAIPRYWIVDRDPANTVTMFALGADGTYQTVARRPLTELLAMPAGEHLPSSRGEPGNKLVGGDDRPVADEAAADVDG